MKRLVVDVDDTISYTVDGDYENASPNIELIMKLRHYKKAGFIIALHTSRNMRTYEGNVGLINANTLPLLITWLDKHDVPYDELITAKPWCGFDGFYIDDKAVRPREFTELEYDQILDLLERDR